MDEKELIGLLEDIVKTEEMLLSIHDKIADICQGDISYEDIAEMLRVDIDIVDSSLSCSKAFSRIDDLIRD